MAHFPHHSLSVPSSGPQRVITTRWGSLLPESKARGSPQRVEMTRWGRWCRFGGGEDQRKAPNKL